MQMLVLAAFGCIRFMVVSRDDKEKAHAAVTGWALSEGRWRSVSCLIRGKQKCALGLIKGAAPSGVTTFAIGTEAAPKIVNTACSGSFQRSNVLLEWSRRMAPLKPCGGRRMHAACWLVAHISESPDTKKPPHGWLVLNGYVFTFAACAQRAWPKRPSLERSENLA